MIDNSLQKLLENKIMSPQVAAYIKLLLNTNHSGLIVGPVKSGKTILLDSMIDLIKKPCNISIIEDTPELRKNDKHSKVILDKKIRDSPFPTTWIPQIIRNRPHMILFGELRLTPDEINHMTSAISAGNLVVSTMHAASAQSAINRLELVGFTGCWKWIILTKKSKNNLGFEIESISEIILENNDIRVIPIYNFNDSLTSQTILKRTHH